MHIYTCSLYFNASTSRRHAQRSHPAATPSCTKQFQPAKKKKNTRGQKNERHARSAGGYTDITSWQQKMLPAAATSTEQLFYRSLHSTTAAAAAAVATIYYYYCWWRGYATIITERLPGVLLLLLYEVYCYGRWCHCYCYYYASATTTAATAATATSLLYTAATAEAAAAATAATGESRVAKQQTAPRNRGDGFFTCLRPGTLNRTHVHARTSQPPNDMNKVPPF